MPDPQDPSSVDPSQILDDQLRSKVLVLNVNGQETPVSIEELARNHQISLAGNQKLAEAAERDKKHEQAMKDFERVNDGVRNFREGIRSKDPGKISRALRQWELSQEEIDTLYTPQQQQGMYDQNPAQDQPDVGNDDDNLDDNPRVAQLEAKLEQATAAINKLTEDKAKEAATSRKARIREEVDDAFAQDDELATILGRLPESSQEKFRALAYTSVSKATEQLPWGPRALESARTDVREFVHDMKKALQEESEEDEFGIPREDRAPGGVPDLSASGLGPSTHTAGQLHQTTTGTPKAVRPFDPNYGASFMDRVKARMKGKR